MPETMEELALAGRSVSIVGTNHVMQHDASMTALKTRRMQEFKDHLVETVKGSGASLLAEEFSQENLQASRASISTVHSVAKQLHCSHLFADPGPQLRTRLGILTDEDRESFWIGQLSRRPEVSVLFVCGDSHVDSFSSRLQHAGAKVTVTSRGWGDDVEEEGGILIWGDS